MARSIGRVGWGGASFGVAAIAAAQAFAIVGGAPTPPRAFPFVVALIDRAAPVGGERQGQYCAGALIAPRWVLTAAHCLYFGMRAQPPGEIDVYAGSDDFTNGDRIRSATFVVYPDFDRLRGFNDIALIRLERAPRADLAIAPVRLASSPFQWDVPLSQSVTAVGWGAAENEDAPAQLRSVELTLRLGRCKRGESLLNARWADIQFLLQGMRLAAPLQAEIHDEIVKDWDAVQPPNQICAGQRASGAGERLSPWEQPAGPCRGDAGGPLLTIEPDGSRLQIGIISFPYGYENKACDDPAHEPFYVAVGAYSDWIQSNVAKP